MASRQILVSLVLALLSCLVVGDQQFTCPNHGKPKLNKHNGRLISCLPGDASEQICGKGYSCFFSGVDYRCCPSNDDADVESHQHTHHSQRMRECPSGSLVVLNADGASLKCNTHSRQCPKPESQFCVQHSSTSICCETMQQADGNGGNEKRTPGQGEHAAGGRNASKAAAARTLVGVGPPPPRLTAKADIDFDGRKAAKVLTQKELNKITVVVNRDIVKLLACPPSSLNVVSTKGLPIKCSESKKCPSAQMFCYRARLESICCQEFHPNATRGGGAPKENVQTRINQVGTSGTSGDANKLVEELRAQAASPPAPESATTARSKIGAPADSESRNKVKNDGAVSDKEEEGKGHVKVNINRSKARAVKTKVEQAIVKTEGANQELVEYKPHGQGGYSVSGKKKPLEGISMPGPDNKHQNKMMAQQFLINQIKSGWPYDEQFYRTGSTATPRTRTGNPAVIVHFPTE